MTKPRKNTWIRNFKARLIRIDRIQQQQPNVPTVDKSLRVCANCDIEYSGRFCPQCGQSGIWSRFSLKQAFLNFIDIWGLGSRPIYRTIRELFWRPGYMIRDYLIGHRQFYFPPFKLLSVTLLLMLAVCYVTGQKNNPGIIPSVDEEAFLPNLVNRIIFYFSRNPIFELCILTAINVCFTKIAFNKIGGYNFTEIFIFLIYLTSILFIIEIPYTLFVGLFDLYYGYQLSPLDLDSLLVNDSLFAVGLGFKIILSVIYYLTSAFLTLLALRQFFGLSWKSTIKRVIYTCIVITILMFLAVVFIMAFGSKDIGMIMFFVSLVLLFLFIVPTFFNENKQSKWDIKLLILCFVLTVIIIFLWFYFISK